MQLQASDIWDTLDKAVVKGMVVQEGDRFRLGESIRDYAREQVDADDDKSTRDRHFHFFAQMAVDTEHKVRGPEQRFWLKAFQNELENMRAALDWAFHQTHLFIAGQELLYNLTPYYFIHGDFAEALRWYEIALQLPTDIDRDLQSRLLRRAGLMALYNDHPQTEGWLRSALDAARQCGVESTMADALYAYGNYLHVNRMFEAATPYLAESHERFRKLNDIYGIGFTLARLGTTAAFRGDFEEAKTYFDESLRLRKEWGDTRGIGASLSLLASLAMQRDDIEEAKSLCGEAIRLFAEVGTEIDFGEAMLVVAWIAASTAKSEIAARLLGFSDAMSRSHSIRKDPADQEVYRRANEQTRTSLNPEKFEEQWTLGKGLAVGQALELALQVL